MLKISFGEGGEQKKGEEILINNVGFFSPKILFSMALVRCPPIVDTGIFFFFCSQETAISDPIPVLGNFGIS